MISDGRGEPAEVGAGIEPPERSTTHRPDLTDEILVARAGSGDPRAFEQLVRRHQQQMYLVALRITGAHVDAEDAAQNAFIAAWRRLPEFRGESTFSTWLYRIVTNYSLNQLRSRVRTDRQGDIATLLEHDQPETTEPGPNQSAEGGALLRELRIAMAALPPELRVCWYAREIDGYAYHEVAVIAGVSYDVARGRIYRARLRIAEEMKAWR